MFSQKDLSKNKFVKYTVYAIVIFLAIWMGLTVVNLGEVKTALSNTDLISVNGVEIYQDESPISGGRIKDYLNDLANIPLTMRYKQVLIENMLDNWTRPVNTNLMTKLLIQQSRDRNIFNFVRKLDEAQRAIKSMVLWKMNLDLAKEIGFDLSKNKLSEHIDNSFFIYMKEEYAKAKEKGSDLNEADYIELNKEHYWRGYYEYGQKHLKNQYIHNLVMTPLLSGSLVTLPDVEMEYKMSNHKVQVDFAVYGYDQFLNDPALKGYVNDKDLKKYYEENRARTVCRRSSFNTEKEANEAKNDPKLFEIPKKKEGNSPAPKVKIPSYRLTIRSMDEHYNDLMSYAPGTVSKVLKGKNNKYYLYKIIKRSKLYEKLKESEKEYNKLLNTYAKRNYSVFQKAYEKRGLELMSGALKKASAGGSLREMASGWMKAGRTEYFSQNTDGVFFLSNKKDKDGKKIPGNDIEEFVALSSGSKSHNKTFFNEAFSLQNGGLSSKVLVEEMQGKFLGRKVYFIIKKVGEKLPDLKGLNVLETKTLMGKIRQADYLVIEALWLNYLQKEMGFSVEINKKSIFQELGIPVPKEPESPEKTAS